MMDFFAERHFALTLQWSNPINQFSVHVLSIGGLDFVFLIAAAAGLVATQWLALIPEPGETRKILWEFKEELSLPFRRTRFAEAAWNTRSRAFDLTAGEVNINDQAAKQSAGTLLPAAQITINKDGDAEFNLFQNPWNLTNVIDWKPKGE